MAELKWRLQVDPGFESQFVAWARARIVDQMRERLLINRDMIVQRIGAYLVDVFWETPVCKAMTGRDPSNDLAAEFGITDEQMGSVAQHMATILAEKIKFLGPGTPASESTVMVAEIHAVSANWALYECGEMTNYTSHPSERQIQWMRWMLEEPAIDFITASFDIVYRGESLVFDARINKKSRSGVAIMATIESLKAAGMAKGGYVFPDICRPTVNKNFLEYTFSQPGVGNTVLDIIKEYLT